MKVLAFNSSPQKDKGNTAMILNPFLEGLKEAGAEVELLYTRDLNIKPCYGDFACWLKTPGKCAQKDDMEWIRPKVGQADVVVLATPVYCDGVTGPMKMLMDRMVPGALPFFEIRDDHTRHPHRDTGKRGKMVLVSSCGLWEKDNFDPMVAHIQAFCRNANSKFEGALLRPHGPALRGMLEAGAPVRDVIDAAKDAGRQLARDGRISSETLSTVSRDLMSREMYMNIVNQYMDQAM
ncbi:MAG TPA: flavodoxin family protein, partial [Methanotrichaceae archaeon]|nr:flavodoxin family protein [Methanotrichaceae archaeon]